ncbi:MAG TPA: acyl-CoA thioesterase [Bacteroidetes bacterium]|nr:acyl-CoA thioesterase [Bacteroidota bacterium]
MKKNLEKLLKFGPLVFCRADSGECTKMAKEIKNRLTVRSYEVDIYGHVNNATYLNYLEFARVQALQQTGKSFVEYVKENIFIVIAQANVTFRNPAFIGNELEIVSSVAKVGRSSLVLQQDIFNRTTNKQSIAAEITIVFLNEDEKPVPVPRQIQSQLGYE